MMERIGSAFIDSVSGKTVSYYRDRHGVIWLKDSKWSRFKVKVNPGRADG